MDARLAGMIKQPEGKTRVLIQFNKISRALTGILIWTNPSTLNQDYFIYVEAMFDFDKEVVVGDADDFEIVSKDSQPSVIYESSLDVAVQTRITKVYPIVKQINVFARAIMKLSEAAGIDQSELHEMLDYIDEVKRENQVRKEFYMRSPDFKFVSNEDVEKQYEEQMEGGLHEAYGGRIHEGGRVF